MIANANAGDELQGVADVLVSGFAVIRFKGDDALGLYVNDVLVDSLGIIGVDPGSEWLDGDIDTKDNTLRRLPEVMVGDILFDDALDLVSQWQSFAKDTFDGLGCAGVEACPTNSAPTATDSTVTVAEDGSWR